MTRAIHVAAVSAAWGPVHVAAWDGGLVACAAMTPRDWFVQRLGQRLRSATVEAPHPVLDRAVAQLEEFLAGGRRTFDLPIDLSDRPAFDQAVLRAVCDVPWGSVASYGQIARAVDRAGAARAVGGAVGRSPFGIIVPCHRVVAADGSLGGYGGDEFASRDEHLRPEARAPPAGGRRHRIAAGVTSPSMPSGCRAVDARRRTARATLRRTRAGKAWEGVHGPSDAIAGG
jgi:methylated-DNA-[protein]-cysteine S-methyltransferase